MRKAGRPGADVSACRLQVHGCAREQRVWLKPRGCPMRRIHLPRAALFVSDHLTGARGSFRSSGCTRTTPGEAPAAPRRAAQHRAERPPTGRAGCFGVCGLVCNPQGRSTTTGLQYSPVPSHTPSSWCRPPGALRYSRCHQHAQLRLGPVPPTAHTCALPTAQIREAALTHRQMRTSLSPAAAAIQPWTGAGRAPRSRRGVAEPRRPLCPSSPALPASRTARLLAADRSSAGKWPGESVRGTGPARSQQATVGSGQSPWSRLSATSTQFLAASATTVVSCRRTRAVQHRAETQVGRQAAIPTRGAARGQGVVEGA